MCSHFINKSHVLFREAAKKSSSLNGRAIKTYPPPPSSLMAVGTLEKKGSKQTYFFLNGPALYPPPFLMALTLKEELFLRLPLQD